MLVNVEYYVSKSGQDKQYLEKPWLVVNGRVNGRVIMKAKGHSNQNYSAPQCPFAFCFFSFLY